MDIRFRSALDPVIGAIRGGDGATPPPIALRSLTLSFALALVGSYLWVFYSLIDIVGGVTRLVAAVAGALVLGTVAARVLPVRAGLIVGVSLFGGGIAAYLVTFPGFQRVVFTPGFAVGLATHLTGVSVLRFPKIGLWVLTTAPGPVFLSWYLALRRRYDASALIGGLVLGFFALTGDAGPTTTVAGMASLLGLLGIGSLERSGSTWDQVEKLGFVLAIAVLASRVIPLVPDRGSPVSPAAAGGSDAAAAGGLVTADEQLDAFEHVTLSSEVQFRIAADEAAYWHVAAYDRYTGSNWIRTGGSTRYSRPLSRPPGESTRLRQTVRVASPVRTMPAAWKPVRVSGHAAADARVTPLEGLQPARWFTRGDTYTVVSQVPEWTPAELREAGTDYPERIRDRYVQFPESTPSRVAAFTARLTEDAGNPYEVALVVERWLGRNRGYSLDVERPDGDLAASFLFEMERGYCTYYATTMAVMLRTQGIPARLAVGYTPGERTADGEWVVRGLDSHAWVEVYFPGVGWVPFDPTPAEPRRRAERARFDPRGDGRAFETGDAGVTPSTPTPSPTADENDTPAGERSPSGTATPAPATPEVGADDPGDGASSIPVPGSFGGGVSRDRIALLSAAAAVVIGANRLGLLERGYRELWIRWQTPSDSPAADVERAFERLEYLLSRRGRTRNAGETPRQYLDALDGVDPRVRRVVDLYERSRYAGAITRDEADEAIELVDGLVADRR